uniref:Uncharacterized protein n=1 Tax=Rhizophora mucronata TaxID=61149 RepID=A0A2P2NY58_RHIMU
MLVYRNNFDRFLFNNKLIVQQLNALGMCVHVHT